MGETFPIEYDCDPDHRLPHRLHVIAGSELPHGRRDMTRHLAWTQRCIDMRAWCASEWGVPRANSRWSQTLTGEFLFANANDAFLVKMRFG